MKREEILVMDLCHEIDYWKNQARVWKKKYDELNDEHNQMVKESIAHGSAMMGNFMMLALHSDEKTMTEAFPLDSNGKK